MNKALRSLSILLFLMGCSSPKSPNEMMEETRKKVNVQIEASNAKKIAWANLTDSIYKIADTNQLSAITAIDNLIIHNISLDSHNISELHFIKGDIYYKIDSLKKSVSEFSFAGQTTNMGLPKHLAARAGAYIKLNQYRNAFADLTKAANINYDYLWNLGNFYEVIGKNDSAISNYNRLYKKDPIAYQFCLARITELKKTNPKALTELIYHDREKTVLMLNAVK